MTKIPYEIVYSPDDEDQSGKGWYAQTFDLAGKPVEESDLLASEKEARDWVKSHGGNLDISSA